MPNLRHGSKAGFERGSLDCESGILPLSYRAPSKEGKKQRGADPMEQCDSGLIFARVKALMSTRAINLNDVLKYELAAVPTSIFDEKSGELRSSKSSEDSRWKLPITQEVPETLWLLMDVPYSGCSNGPQRIH